MTALTSFGLPEPSAAERDGRALYGDNFTPEQIAVWFANEEHGFHSLAETLYAPEEGADFESLAADTYHFYRHLGARRFEVCLALGCGDAQDVSALATRAGRFIAIEPAREWWRSEIGGTPAEYRMPRPDGRIDLPDGAVDLVTVFSVLHHIPNVAAVVAELARVLAPGGLMLLREPSIAMGDFTRPRHGLTAHERGIAPPLLEAMFAANRLAIRRRAPLSTNALGKALAKLGIGGNTAFAARADAWASRALAFNHRYDRRTLLDKIGPASIAYILEKS